LDCAERHTRLDVLKHEVRPFVPNRLPPQPPLELTAARQRLLERSTWALGRLDWEADQNRYFVPI
jgi:hypothetical protein